MQKLLLFGANGQLGARLMQQCAEREIACVALTRAECDAATIDDRRLRALIESHAPTHILNATAYTAVDKAESEKELTYTINADAPKIMAETAQACGVPFIHFSTDYVFDGTRGAPYTEEAATHPLNVYGASKLAGEAAALSAGATVFRLQWVYDTRGSNFLLQMRKHFAAQHTMRIVADQWGTPSYAKHLADAVLDGLQLPSGLYHLTPAGFTSWHGFACEIHRAIPQPLTQAIAAITSAEYPSAATRPLDTRLNTDKLAAHGITLPHWRDGLREAMEELSKE